MSQVQRRDSFLNEALAELDSKFMLAGYDERQAWNSLTAAEMAFITGEVRHCKSDSRYYLENYHVIKTEDNRLTTLYPLYDSQEIFFAQVIELQLEGKPVKLIILKARQLGLSTVCQGLLFQKTIFTPLCNTLIVAQDPGQSGYLFDMSRLAYDSLPWWMRPEARYESKASYLIFDRKDEKERRLSPGLQSNIWVEAQNKMTGVAVGKMLHCAHMSELSLWVEAQLLTKMIWPSLNAPDGLYFMESTARGRAHWWFPLWRQSEAGNTEWSPVFIPFYRVRKYSIPIAADERFVRTPEETALCERVQREDGFTITNEILKWRRVKMNAAIAAEGDEWGFYQEYPSNAMEAFQASGLCAFNKKKLHSLFELTCRPPLWYGEIFMRKDEKTQKVINGTFTFNKTLRRLREGDTPPPQESHGARLRIWEWPVPNAEYYIGGDVAQGIKGGDYSAAQVIRKGKGMRPDVQVAEWHGWINPYDYAEVLAALGYFYNTAGLACEANDVGRATNAELYRVLEYPNMYQFKNPDKFKNFMTDWFGWYTNSKNRTEIIAKFRKALDEDIIVLKSRDLVDECFDFSSIDGGRYEGQEGHDDRVMSMLITYYCAHDMDWAASEDAPRVDPKNDRPGADFYNTDYSPLYNHPEGLRQKMFEAQGRQNPETILYSELEGVTPEEPDWRNM